MKIIMRANDAAFALCILWMAALAPRPALATCDVGQLVLGPALSMPLGPSPTGIVTGDFNHDGIPDLVVALSHLGYGYGYGNGELAYLHGRGVGGLGDGTFDSPVLFGAGSTPLFLATADLNGDGNPDIVATYFNAYVVGVMLGDGAGHFTLPILYPTGNHPHHVVLADFNLDGILDIAVSNSGEASVSVLLGNGSNHVGDGTFAPASALTLNSPCTGIVAGDVNGDGKPDLLATENNTGSIAILLGNGNGTFQVAAHRYVSGTPYNVFLDDVTGDGKLDALICFAAGNAQTGLGIAHGNGDGTFGSVNWVDTYGVVNSVRAVDMDGDGLLDLVTTISDLDQVGLYHGEGAAGLNSGIFTPRPRVHVANFPVGLAIADYNGDGLPDAMVTSYTGTTLSLLPGACAVLPPPFAIDHVRDVPNDQGGKVWLTWPAHAEDISQGAVTGYRVWRRIPAPAPAARASRDVRMTIAGGAPVFWEAAATLPAQRLAAYGYTAATSQDSLAGGNPFTAFFVTATTSSPDIFHDSPVDSGYSVDNLAPAAPAQVTGQFSGAAVLLSWTANAEPDLYGYRVHRGNDAFFTPGAANLVGSPTSPSFHDATGGHFYKVAAVDVHGNVGPFVLVQPAAAVGVTVGLVSSAAGPAGVTLTWYADPQVVPFATLERDDGEGLWQAITSGAPDGGGWLVLTDTGVKAGASYRYRLTWVASDGLHASSIVDVTVPGLSLSLAGARPNPSTGGALAVRFSLRDGSPATLELFDVNGRRVLGRDVGSLGAGEHVIDLAALRLSPGLYLARLAQGGEKRQQRIVIVP